MCVGCHTNFQAAIISSGRGDMAEPAFVYPHDVSSEAVIIALVCGKVTKLFCVF